MVIIIEFIMSANEPTMMLDLLFDCSWILIENSTDFFAATEAQRTRSKKHLRFYIEEVRFED
jgi:hypothetical protein